MFTFYVLRGSQWVPLDACKADSRRKAIKAFIDGGWNLTGRTWKVRRLPHGRTAATHDA